MNKEVKVTDLRDGKEYIISGNNDVTAIQANQNGTTIHRKHNIPIHTEIKTDVLEKALGWK